MKSCKIIIFTLIILFFPITFTFASGQTEEESQEITIHTTNIEDLLAEILADYDPENLSEEDIISINELFRNLGLIGGDELDEALLSLGFNPDELKIQLPPPPTENNIEELRRPQDKKPNEENLNPTKIFESLTTEYGPSNFTLTSSAIENGKLNEENIEKDEIHIPLSWENIPEGTKSLAIIMYDFPNPEDQTIINAILLLWGIDPSINKISWDKIPGENWYMANNRNKNINPQPLPFNPNIESKEFHVAIFALSNYPIELPMENSTDVNFINFMDAIENSEILGKAELTYCLPTIKAPIDINRDNVEN